MRRGTATAGNCQPSLFDLPSEVLGGKQGPSSPKEDRNIVVIETSNPPENPWEDIGY